MIVVGITGLIGSGKSTIADHLIASHGFTRVKFAGPLKAMMRALGLSEREIEGDLKEKPCDLLGGRSPRYAMQTIGTDWGRDMIAPDLWVRAWGRACEESGADRIVADDVRFPNEAAAIRAPGKAGLLLRVQRTSGHATGNAHVSELQAFPADLTIQNSGTVADLLADVDQALLTWEWARTAT